MKFKSLLLLLFMSFALSGQTVVDIIVNSDDHTILETAVTEAGLVETLQGDGPFTVFAPTDAAFGNLPDGLLELLLEDPTGDLTDILLYHVAGAEYPSGELMDMQEIVTVNGKSVTVTIDGGMVMINDALVTVANVPAENGLVHVLDAVLIPPSVTVVDIIVNSDDHTILETAVTEAGLVETLQGDGPFTVFAPTDAAFGNLPDGVLDLLLEDPMGDLTDILLYHVAGAEYPSGELMDMQEIVTVNGKSVTVTIDGGMVMINDALVTVANVPADNGIVHVIDAVLIPPSVTVVDIIVNSDDHAILEIAVGEAGLVETLQGDGPFTVFAPTDAAFGNLPDGVLDVLLEDPTGTLTDILLYHVAGAEYPSGELSNLQEIVTINGQSVTVTIDNGMVMINDALVTVANIPADNGIVHVIDAVLLPTPASLPLDFELPASAYNFEGFEGADSAIEPNPDQSGVNTSDNIMRTIKTEGAQFFASTLIDLDENIDFSENTTINIDTWSPKADIPVRIALESNGGGNQIFVDVNTIVANEWETLSADFSEVINTEIDYGRVVVFFEFIVDLPGDGSTYYFDNIEVAPLPSILEIVANSDDHNTLETAVVEAGLDGVLGDVDQNLTVFAPTDAAFDNLPDGVLDALLEDPMGELTDILLYHVAEGVVQSSELSDMQEIVTLNGKSVTVTIDNGMVMIDNALVTVADIPANNGIVHVIDAVLLPSTTIVDIIVNSDDHTILETAVIEAGLVETLEGDGPFTVFAPTDAAFGNLPDGVLDDLLEDPTGELADILLYHAVAGEAESTSLSDGMPIRTINGQIVKVTIDNGMVMINDALVTIADVPADNGIVHIIDAVLLPPTETVVDIIVNSDDHNTLETAVIAAELVETLQGDGPFTVFAPTDQAFENLPDGLLDTLLADPSGDLTEVLLYHVVAAQIISTDITEDISLEMVNGEEADVTIDPIMIDNAMVIVTDLVASNGIVHVIDVVLVPNSVATNEIEALQTTIYPNPASQFINVDMSQLSGDFMNIYFYNNAGQLIDKQKIRKNQDRIDVSNLNSGLYQIILQDERKQYQSRFLKM